MNEEIREMENVEEEIVDDNTEVCETEEGSKLATGVVAVLAMAGAVAVGKGVYKGAKWTVGKIKGKFADFKAKHPKVVDVTPEDDPADDSKEE